MVGIAKEQMHKNGILVAVDFSKNADYAIARAIEIAKSKNLPITLLHIVQRKSMDNFLDSTLKHLLPKGLWLTTEEVKASQMQEMIKKHLPVNVNLNYVILKNGLPAKKILQYARKNKVALLIIGAHGRHSIRDSFVGTTAEYISQRTQCPVLIVKNPPSFNYRKILAPVDFSNVSKKALQLAIDLLPQSRIHLLHVGDYEFEHLLQREASRTRKNNLMKIRKAILLYLLNQTQKFIKGYQSKSIRKPYDIMLGYPGPTIIKKADKLKSDLIVMGTQGHGRMHYLFIGRTANWVLTESNQDVLLVPPKSKNI